MHHIGVYDVTNQNHPQTRVSLLNLHFSKHLEYL